MALVIGCQAGDVPYNPGTGTGTGNPGDKVCTDPATCCKPEELKCVGDPDKGVVCSCKNLWDCDYNQSKCSQPIGPPTGGGGWNCTSWNEFEGLTCEKPGTSSDVPEGNGDWRCSYNSELKKIICKENNPSNPNGPGGAGKWNCKPTTTEGVPKLVCDKKDGGTPPPPPKGGGDWDCNQQLTDCKKKDGDKGIPPGGGNWKCHEETVNGKKYITCVGTSSSPPGGGSWTCTKLPNSETEWICRREKTPGDTPPSGGGHWACQSGSEFGGTICKKVDQPPTPPTPFPKPGEICVPGVKRWCDGLKFCGWGVITCKPDGTWPTRMVNGKLMLDCHERADGKRPDTTCACYHFYYNPKCCERPDCIIPEGKDGRTCKPSAGNLCDYCNPQKPECKQGICAVSNSMETFCTQPCGANKSCPTGMICMGVKNKGTVSNQCIPADFSCYNGNP